MTTEARQTPIAYGRDIEPGQVFSLSEYTVPKDELVAFAERWDPQRFHVDEEVAEAGVYGGLIASGIHSLAILQRLSVLDVYAHWAVIAGKSMTDVEFLRPVRPGDTLTGSITITDVAFNDRNRALVETVCELTVGGKPVLRLAMASYLHATPQH